MAQTIRIRPRLKNTQISFKDSLCAHIFEIFKDFFLHSYVPPLLREARVWERHQKACTALSEDRCVAQGHFLQQRHIRVTRPLDERSHWCVNVRVCDNLWGMWSIYSLRSGWSCGSRLCVCRVFVYTCKSVVYFSSRGTHRLSRVSHDWLADGVIGDTKLPVAAQPHKYRLNSTNKSIL